MSIMLKDLLHSGCRAARNSFIATGNVSVGTPFRWYWHNKPGEDTGYS